MITKQNLNLWLLGLLIAALGSSCISQKKTWLLQDSPITVGIHEFNNPAKEAYMLQSGDNLYITVYSTDKATSAYFQTNFPSLVNPTYLYLNSYVIDIEGYLSFSFIDKIYVKGLTVEQTQKKLQETMNKFFKDVTVSIKLTSFDVSVLGEVESPGKFSITEEQITIFEALALANGPREFANIKKVTLLRKSTTGTQVQLLDLSTKEILQSEFYYLQPNDVIYIESMPSKSYALEKFPYSILISVVSLTLALTAIF